MKWSIKLLLLLALLGTALAVTFAFSVMLYRVQVDGEISRIKSNAETILQPLLTLGQRGVAGGNLMKLKNDDAKALYQSSRALYLHFKGQSDGSPASDFMAAIQPQTIDYEYTSEGFSLASVLGNNRMPAETRLLPEQGLYILVQPLPVKNGGSLVAVFPATELQGITGKVIAKTLPMAAIVLLVSALASYVIGIKLVRPINLMVERISGMGQDLDLCGQLEPSSIREVDAIRNSLCAFLKNMRETLVQVQQVGAAIQQANHRVESAVSDSESGLVSQRKQLELLSSAITEMATSVQQVATNASANAREVESGGELVQQGQATVATTVDSIRNLEHGIASTNTLLQELNRATHEIGSVLEVISGIAEQTNLLALNAAIEAARAGEQGRGFAVVADEVRALASRTKDSTVEVNSIIGRLQNTANQSLSAMECEVRRATASVQHAETVNDVFTRIQQAINNIQTMTGQTALSTDEQAAVSQSINRSVIELNELVGASVRHIGDTRNAVRDVETHLADITQRIGQFRV